MKISKDNHSFIEIGGKNMLNWYLQSGKESDVVIIILPAGRGTHVELGMAIALNKKIYLYSNNKEEFDIENTVAFYQIPSIQKITGDIDYAVNEITK